MYIKKSRLVIGAIILVIITAVISVSMVNPFGFTRLGDFLKFSYTSKLIDAAYYEEIDQSEAANMAIAGVAASTGDPYTNYLWGDMATDYISQVEGNYCGVGLYIEYDIEKNLISVVSAIAGGPAEAAGITTGDKILKIDGEVYAGSQLSEAAAYMKGEENTDVVLTVRRAKDGCEEDITLTRRHIELASVSGKMLDNNIGVLSLTQFLENSAEQFNQEYESLKTQGMTSLIIDLRNNPGGLLDQAIEISSMFVPSGEVITYTLDKYGDKEEYLSDNDGDIIDMPTVVLLNEGSASASEVLTGVLRDYEIADIIGGKSYGKGIVQSVFALGEEEVLSVTVARYYTPDGICIHGKGITPDIEVPMDIEKSARISSLAPYDDEQLLAAIEHLTK